MCCGDFGSLEAAGCGCFGGGGFCCCALCSSGGCSFCGGGTSLCAPSSCCVGGFDNCQGGGQGGLCGGTVSGDCSPACGGNGNVTGSPTTICGSPSECCVLSNCDGKVTPGVAGCAGSGQTDAPPGCCTPFSSGSPCCAVNACCAKCNQCKPFSSGSPCCAVNCDCQCCNQVDTCTNGGRGTQDACGKTGGGGGGGSGSGSGAGKPCKLPNKQNCQTQNKLLNLLGSLGSAISTLLGGGKKTTTSTPGKTGTGAKTGSGSGVTGTGAAGGATPGTLGSISTPQIITIVAVLGGAALLLSLIEKEK
jgi:hypothetical protein